MYYTYVLKMADGHLYIGASSDLKKRLETHKQGKVTATANRLPFKLIYYEACIDKLKCFKREKYFKTGFGRRFLKQRI